ncbi:hypothetical protein SK355_11350 [Candidatus Fukatsuia symbiotica]|uniref:Uncharacterized protein n=1 Tax=Candidatus Fukatsuia symbiotica TaxID=1878942 RepID=A0A2U8I441_9GAMM|nr:hypothetical protein [Candidatus Fukatsuia symbiotica]AWK13888.1 hypothetical protein CCS41_04420 [Candidatus Fukatsuia symbiotica]MEA9445777.1 hypothetical protein [Candidatus Fukatsuia symbiotica]
MIHSLTTLSRHSHQYREFVIIRHPKTVTNLVNRYHLWFNNHSFGKVDTLEQATKHIDWLHQMKEEESLR